jgi:hypothetical protein
MKISWIDEFIRDSARNAERRYRGEKPGAPNPQCPACRGEGWVHTPIEGVESGWVHSRCDCTWPRIN